MRRRLVVIFLLLATTFPTLSGCGTLMNMQTEAPPPGPFTFWPDQDIPSRRVFGGVRYDAWGIWSTCCYGLKSSDAWQKLFWLGLGTYVLLVDTVPTLVGDVVTLPWTIAAAIDRANGIPTGYSTFRQMQSDHESNAAGGDSGGQPASK
jgi:hypothetical protein